MNAHPHWNELNDLVDGGEIPEVAAHVAVCPDCARDVDALRRLVGQAAGLPSVEPPLDAWPALRQSVTSLPRARRTRRWAYALAAGLLIAAASSALTVAVVSRGKGSARFPAAQAVEQGSAPAALAEVADFEAGYLSTLGELSAAYEAALDRLAPETLRAIERNLATIDAAIGEVRSALVADPASGILREILGRQYVQKIQLLRHTAERLPST